MDVGLSVGREGGTGGLASGDLRAAELLCGCQCVEYYITVTVRAALELRLFPLESAFTRTYGSPCYGTYGDAEKTETTNK